MEVNIMKLDEIIITKMIIDSWSKDLIEYSQVDVAVVGAGPSGLTAGYYLAKQGKKVVIFERKLSPGGGMWGGGMMFNKCVFQEEAKEILNEFGIKTKSNKEGYYLTDSLETASKLCAKAIDAGVKIFNLISVEDLLIREEKITGLVINWYAAESAKLHVDPMTIRACFIIDATGHEAEIAKIITRKIGKKLSTPTGDLIGEKPMWAEEGERLIVENTKEAYPGLYIAGMACNAVFGGPRMGPIFGGMVLSGKKVAELLIERLK
jgi:thiamine thiazole synthase